MIVWEVNARDEFGSEHIAQFRRKENAYKHFKECLREYGCATPPYEIDDDCAFCDDNLEQAYKETRGRNGKVVEGCSMKEGK